MKLVKMFGLAVVAAVAAMAFVGATSASASSYTQLCKAHTSLTCGGGQAATTVSMENSGPVTLLNVYVDVICNSINATGAPLALASPQSIHISSIDFENCESSISDHCLVTLLEYPLVNLLKTGLDAGTITAASGQFLLMCEDILFGIDMHCMYDATGLQFPIGAQHLTANEVPINLAEGSSGLCWNEPTLDGLLTAKSDLTSATVLCKTHTEPCAEKNQVKSIDMTTTKAPVLYNTVANVECESSLAAATVLSPAEPQKLDVTALSWNECHTQGAAENCTVTTGALPTIDLDATALNLGSAQTLGLEIEVDCLILDLIELDCTYDSDATLQVEGALHKEGSGHGRFTAAKAVLELAEGSEHCPDEIKWEASYEASVHTYVVASSSEGRYILA